jgi:hypothetical protein
METDPNTVSEHEREFARWFIVPKKRDRYLTLIGTEKGRFKLRYGLNHCDDLDMRHATRVPIEKQNAATIERILRQKGAPSTCHVMSSNGAIDGEDISLRRALEETVGQGAGTLISCVPGKLAYFEFEDPGERYILER